MDWSEHHNVLFELTRAVGLCAGSHEGEIASRMPEERLNSWTRILERIQGVRLLMN
jgi:hypothetical protein